MTIFRISKGFPPDRESAVAELIVSHEGFVDVPAAVYLEEGEMKISIFGREGGVAWKYPLRDWVDAVQRAVESLEQR